MMFILLCVSCNPKEEVIISHIHNATIKVSVYSINVEPTGNVVHIPIVGAKVDLFETEYDMINDINRILSASSDSEGKAQFINLIEEYYYIKASHPTYGQQLEETATPDGSVSFVEFAF